ncbi:hypothetical protein G6F63_016605 [Rhizopus arrhizus]|nr:hypothetical protein G6F22_019965 [Rhizopus arrhizus]KAG1305260.1 hypothetical protein G6F63_016605 [Rhizopus arrhizus]
MAGPCASSAGLATGNSTGVISLKVDKPGLDDASTRTSISGWSAENLPMRGTSHDDANEGTVLTVSVRWTE